MSETHNGEAGRCFRHITDSDRLIIETLRNKNHTQREIAAYLGFSPSTISRELKRGAYAHTNSDLTESVRYSCDKSGARRKEILNDAQRPLKIGANVALSKYIEDGIMSRRLSPDAVLATARRDGLTVNICTMTLYRYIDAGVFIKLTNKDLPVKGKRGVRHHARRTQKRASAGVSIEKRPPCIDRRDSFGHWEMDTVKGKQGVSKSCILVLTERMTRYELSLKLPDQRAASVVNALNAIEAELNGKSLSFSCIFKTITMDNGVEFSDCRGIRTSPVGTERCEAFYCHAYSSYERGSNENANRLVRRFVPKGADTDAYGGEYIKRISDWMNDLPRRKLGYKTARELFTEQTGLGGIPVP